MQAYAPTDTSARNLILEFQLELLTSEAFGRSGQEEGKA